ncbi:LicD family protein [Geodermatophilus dictyosporus]|uniref:LicD family protein n=1 Tax=Geodermatophilus dictyosporus TaxID=1523247 RepID=A0A1I5LCH5_9ACTN|nr:class I SAM-dependent methyltransferase [Geodermatophilus dictyosporus]SFO94566.1 LicD family protein [Geodermatophilus dictyosporus]
MGFAVAPSSGQVLPAVVEVLLEGHRTVSFRTDAAERRPDGRAWFPWPTALAERLAGVAAVVVRDAACKDVLASAEVAFSPEPARVDLRDGSGRWLSVNKWGRLAPSFDGLDPVRRRALQDRLLDRLDAVRRVLEEAGLQPFVCYGTLLGAVRDGDLIPHDDDADLGYLSRQEHPADVVRENLELERVLRARGYSVVRHSGGHLQLVFTDDEGAQDHYIDVFTAFEVEGCTYLCFQVGAADLDLRTLSEVTLRGRRHPAPAAAERLLAETYGPGWRTPDPSFTFTTPHAVRSRLSTWIGEFDVHRDYWQDFYSSTDARKVPTVESDFARWVAERLPAGAAVLDVGTGTARDARFFARSGRTVHAVDYSAAAVERGRALARQEGWAAGFEVVNLADLSQVGSLAADLDPALDWHLYARFLVHAIDDQARANLWRLAAAVARRGGECWFEFRTHRDEQAEHAFGEHFRRYLDPAQVVVEAKEHDLQVLDLLEDRGLAVYGGEDPWVARLRLGAA